MSRSGYHDDLDNWDLIRWRGQVASAIRGKRGQVLLKDMLAALDSMPEKALVTSELETEEGDVCALGALGKARGMDLRSLDPEESESVAAAFNIAEPLAKEIVYENDEHGWIYGAGKFRRETPEERWKRMRAWVVSQIKPEVIHAAD